MPSRLSQVRDAWQTLKVLASSLPISNICCTIHAQVHFNFPVIYHNHSCLPAECGCVLVVQQSPCSRQLDATLLSDFSSEKCHNCIRLACFTARWPKKNPPSEHRIRFVMLCGLSLQHGASRIIAGEMTWLRGT